MRGDGLWMFDGYKVTAFNNEEDDQTRAGRLGMPWYLETALKNADAVFDDTSAAVGIPCRRRSQPDHRAEPMSADAMADAVLKRLPGARA